MKIKYIVWGVGFDGESNYVGKVRDGFINVNKFNVGCCMEGFFEDNEFSWSENSDGFKFNGNDNCIVVEGIDGYERWVFIKE